MSSITDYINKATKTNTLNVPIISPTKVKAGTTSFNFRILPYKYNDHGDPFVEIFVHSNIGPDKKNFALCKEMENVGSCPYCQAAKKLRNELSKEEWAKISKDFYATRSIYAPGIKRGTIPEFYFIKMSGFQNFDREIISILTDAQLKELFKLPENVEYINLWDLKMGVDLVVKLNGRSEKIKNPSFTIDKALKQTPAWTNKNEEILVKESIKNVPNLLEEMKKAWGDFSKIDDLFNKQYKKNQTTSNNNSLNTQSSTQSSNQSSNQSSTSNTSSDNNSSVPQNENYTTDEINVDDINIDEINNSPADNASVNNTVEDEKLDDDFDAIMAEIDKK